MFRSSTTKNNEVFFEFQKNQGRLSSKKTRSLPFKKNVGSLLFPKISRSSSISKTNLVEVVTNFQKKWGRLPYYTTKPLNCSTLP